MILQCVFIRHPVEDVSNTTLNWWRGVKLGRTDWLRLRWSACFLSVVSDTDLDIPGCFWPPDSGWGGWTWSWVILVSRLLSSSTGVRSSSSPLSSPRTTSWSCTKLWLTSTSLSSLVTRTLSVVAPEQWKLWVNVLHILLPSFNVKIQDNCTEQSQLAILLNCHL